MAQRVNFELARKPSTLTSAHKKPGRFSGQPGTRIGYLTQIDLVAVLPKPPHRHRANCVSVSADLYEKTRSVLRPTGDPGRVFDAN